MRGVREFVSRATTPQRVERINTSRRNGSRDDVMSVTRNRSCSCDNDDDHVCRVYRQMECYPNDKARARRASCSLNWYEGTAGAPPTLLVSFHGATPSLFISLSAIQRRRRI